MDRDALRAARKSDEAHLIDRIARLDRELAELNDQHSRYARSLDAIRRDLAEDTA